MTRTDDELMSIWNAGGYTHDLLRAIYNLGWEDAGGKGTVVCDYAGAESCNIDCPHVGAHFVFSDCADTLCNTTGKTVRCNPSRTGEVMASYREHPRYRVTLYADKVWITDTWVGHGGEFNRAAFEAAESIQRFFEDNF